MGRVLALVTLAALAASLSVAAPAGAQDTVEVSGRVVDEDGDPVAGVNVTLQSRKILGEFYSDDTGAGGRFFIDADPDDGPFFAYVQDSSVLSAWWGGGGDAFAAALIDVSGGDVGGIDFTVVVLGPMPTVSGTVTDDQGAPLEGLCVRHWGTDGGFGAAFTDENGDYELTRFVHGNEYTWVHMRAEPCHGGPADPYCVNEQGIIEPFRLARGDQITGADFVIDDAQTPDLCHLRTRAEPHVDRTGDGYGDLMIGTLDEQAIYYAEGGDRGFERLSQYDSAAGEGTLYGHSLTFGHYGPQHGYIAVLGAPGFPTNGQDDSGQARYTHGGFSRIVSQAGSTPGAPEVGDLFAYALASGDFDGDWYYELAAGVPGEDSAGHSNAGGVSVHDGLQNSNAEFFSQAGSVVGEPEAGDKMGSALAVGDFDGDGYDDLAVGVPFEDVAGKKNAGGVNVLYGGPNSLRRSTSQFLSQKGAVKGKVEVGDRFGSALAAGDFDGDGYDDLAVGAPYENVGSEKDAGSVNIIFGSADGLRRSGGQIFSLRGALVGAPRAGDLFGFSLAAGDFDNDGRDDLAIGAPNDDFMVNGARADDAGSVHLLDGSPSGLVRNPLRLVQLGPLEGQSEDGDLFGYALAAGVLSTDRRDDLAIGIPGESHSNRPGAGAVAVVYGSGSGLRTTNDDLITNHRVFWLGPNAGERFGAALWTSPAR